MPIVGKKLFFAYKKVADVAQNIFDSKAISGLHKEDLYQALMNLRNAIEYEDSNVRCECTTSKALCDTEDCPICEGTGLRRMLDW